MKNKNTFYVTTPIYYVTAKPHLGSLYSTVIADMLARFNQLQGKQTFFLTGTDEHGQKVAQAAKDAGMQPKKFVDQFIPAYKDTWKLFDIDYSKFIRTTDDDHKKSVQKLITQLIDQGDIYTAEYEGWYCTPCETFITAKELDENNPTCPSCSRPVQKVSEETYFFRLSKYEKQLLDFYKNNPNFISPKERFNELISFVESGLKDISISRTTVSWGVPFPGDEKHVLYVWIEALCNYITGVGYKTNDQTFQKWWPADVHVIGKDIIRFHGVYWPALLMAAKLELPKQLLVHGWITVDEQKMSKSLGNVVDPVELAKNYGVDEVRYFLLRQLAVNQDGNFSIQDLEKRISTELANDLGNLLQRTVTLATKSDLQKITYSGSLHAESQKLQQLLEKTVEQYVVQMQNNQFHIALATVWEYISAVNSYFHQQEPWKQLKADKNLFTQTIYVTCHSLYAIACLLWPVLPKKSQELLLHIGFDGVDEIKNLVVWDKVFTVTVGLPLFKKYEMKTETEKQIEKKEETSVVEKSSEITIDALIKVEILVGTIVACEQVEKSDKLLKLQVNFGQHGTRQIVSGIKKWYKPEDLINTQAIFAFNLQPRTLFGLESQGMIMLATDQEGVAQIVRPVVAVPAGTRLK